VRVVSLGLLSVALFLPTSSPMPRTKDSSPIARVDTGLLLGRQNGSTAVFEGVPYAAPPLGVLRWRDPEPRAPWVGVRDATRPESACVQNDIGIDRFVGPLAAAYGVPYAAQKLESSEDCLYLNVWAPHWPAKTALPVMVWLHGGSNTAGSGSQTTYDGISLASHGVIVVTVNYRLGVLGFFSHPELSKESGKESGHHSSGNYGLLDQIAALRWVRENISQFGGDPKNVTVFGESAGSIDAGVLIASPLSTGLFRRAILESGPPFGLGAVHHLNQAEAVGAAIGKAAPGNSSALDNLRSLPATAIVKLASSVMQNQFNGYDMNSGIIDGWLLHESPANAYASGRIQKVDLMIGINGRELSAFRITAAAVAKQSGQTQKSGSVGDALKSLADTTRSLYGNWTDLAVGVYLSRTLVHRDAAIDQATNDMMMACPAGAVAALINAAGQRAYVYKFDRSIPGKGESELGAFHGLEIPFVFNAFDDRGWRWLPFSATDHKLSQTMESYWTNFAKTGDPNSAGLPAWSYWGSSREPYLEFNQAGDPVPQRDFSPLLRHLSPERLKQQLTGK
jgi:para-nitrobenzyl esterase